MTIEISVKRQKSPDEKSYVQTFNYEGDGNGIFYVFIQVTDDQHLSGETNF